MLITLAGISIVFAALRFVVPVSGKVNRADIYKDLAHIWVGVLFGVAIAECAWQFWALPIALTVVEVIAFFSRKGG